MNDLERFEYEWHQGSRAVAREIAHDYVMANAARLSVLLDALSEEGVVKLIDAYREAGQDEDGNYLRQEDITVATMWILDRYPPRHISGTLNINSVVQGVADAVAEAMKERLA